MLLTPGLTPWIAYEAKADTVTTAPGLLPTGRERLTAIAVGSDIYVFGGWDKTFIKEIVRYNTTTGSVTAMGAQLPTGRYGASAVWTGEYAYVFGGCTPTACGTNETVRYDPATDTAVLMPRRMYIDRFYASAIYDGTHAYIFGGCALMVCPWNNIMQYDPATDSYMNMSSRLPNPRERTAAVWSGEYAYIFGGCDVDQCLNRHGGPLDQIVRFDPAADLVQVMAARLPAPLYRTSAAWDGAHAYLFGGCNNTDCASDRIYRYDPSTDNATTMDGRLPTVRYGTAAVWVGGAGHVVGGYDGSSFFRQIVKYVPPPPTPPSAPQGLVATPGPGAGEISLTWQAPASNGGAPISGYNVYRGTSAGAEVLHAAIGGQTTHVDPGLGDGATLYYQISASNVAGEGPVGNEAVASTPAVPSAPLAFSAVAGPGAGQITLAWSTPVSGGPVTGYRIHRASASGAEVFLLQTGPGTSYVDPGLPTGASRFYQVAAMSAAGTGPLSGEANATTFAAPSGPTSLVSATGAGAGTISLTWAPPTSNGGSPVTHYRIYRGTTSGSLSVLAQFGPVLAYDDTGLPNNATRYYRISAVNIAGEGIQASEVSAASMTLVPGAPRNLSAKTQLTPGNILLSWQPPSSDGGDGVDNYVIYRGAASGGEVPVTTLGNVTSFLDTGRGLGPWFYKVRAGNVAGTGPESNEAMTVGTSPRL